jgi:hypothetical protein
MFSLESVDFSYNNLSGEIPTGKSFRDDSPYAYVGNTGLCGDFQGLISCYTNTNNNSDNHRKKLIIAIFAPISGVILLAATILMILVLSKKRSEERKLRLKV